MVLLYPDAPEQPPSLVRWPAMDVAESAGRFTALHRSERRTFTTPALVIGHHRDPVHPFSDAGLLAEELPNGRLLEAGSIIGCGRPRSG